MEPSMDELKALATLQQIVYGKEQPTAYKTYETLADGTVAFPRFFLHCMFPNTKSHDQHRQAPPTSETSLAPWPTTRTLDPARKQDIAVAAALESIRGVGGATVCLPCGFGKTTCALVILAQVAQKAFVMVNTTELAAQWLREVKGILPGCTATTAPDMDGDVVVGTFQLVTRGNLELGAFGALVVDEAHHAPAETFRRAICLFPPRVCSLGLTATPRRRDGLEKLIEWTLGPLAFVLSREDAVKEGIMQAAGGYTVKALSHRAGHALRRPVPPRFAKFPLVWLRKQLANDPARNQLIIAETLRMAVDQCRAVLVLTALREHAVVLADALRTRVPHVRLMLGGRRRIKSNSGVAPAVTGRPCIVATTQLVGEGFDEPELDGLVLALPVADIEQLVGRVMRPHPDKVWPVRVVDVEDAGLHDIVSGMYWKRRHQMTRLLSPTFEKTG